MMASLIHTLVFV